LQKSARNLEQPVTGTTGPLHPLVSKSCNDLLASGTIFRMLFSAPVGRTWTKTQTAR
jgi:hypothetical protein